MNSRFLHKWQRILFGRVARNAYFWLIYILFPVINLNNRTELHLDLRLNILLNLLTALVFAIIVYFNNLLLIPQLFNKKKYVYYFPALTFWAFISAYLVQLYYIQLFRELPEIFQQKDQQIAFPYFASFFIVALHLTGFSMAKFANDFFVREKSNRDLERRQVQSELNFLKSQINPHFLFNTLNSIYSLALKKSEDTADVVLRLSDILRYMLYECNTDRIHLSKEIEILSSYVELERIRTRRVEGIQLTIEGNPANLQIAPLIWMGLIENAFKHGLSSRIGDGYVHIHIVISQHTVIFNCENNYKKIDRPQSDLAGGIGLVNMQKRLLLIYPDKHKFIVSHDNEKYNAQLILNLS
jgi:hypothetical protein